METNYDINYIEAKMFDQLYLNDLITIGRGSFGIIYANDKYAIKKFAYIRDLIIELNIYSLVKHPCILHPIAWSVINGNGFMAMPRGKSIRDALHEHKITIEEVISDTLSAISFMNSVGIAHRDIKPDNMIFIDRCMIIDMGLAVKCILNNDDQYYTINGCYTIPYRDPEYSEKQYNNIKVEIYSLAMSYKELLTLHVPEFGDLIEYKCNIPHIDWFFDQAKKPLIERPKICEIIETAPVELIKRRYTGFLNRPQPMNVNKISSINLKLTLDWISVIVGAYRFKSSTGFLALHLVHRTFGSIFSKYKAKSKTFKIYACVIIRLASVVSEETEFHIEDAQDISNDNDINYRKVYNQMMLDLLILLKGLILTHTYWDFAKSSEELPSLLFHTMSFEYNVNTIMNFTTSETKMRVEDDTKYSDKCVNFNEIVYDVKSFVENKTVHPLKIFPCNINIEGDITFLNNTVISKIDWQDNKEYSDYIAIILHNRKILNQIGNRIAIKVFSELYDNRKDAIVKYLLDIVCKFDWKKWYFVVMNNLNYIDYHVFVVGNDYFENMS